jgi:PKHD-type hydroxylase
MNTNEWFFFPANTIDKEACNKLIKLAEGKWEKSVVNTSLVTTDEERKYGNTYDYKPDHKIRISDVFFTDEQWVMDLIIPHMLQANEEAGWKYHIKAAEMVQITRYNEGGFYNFHADGKGDHLSAYNNPQNPMMHGHVRKLSMSIMLNDSYEGGAFEFANFDANSKSFEITPIEPKTGSIIIFRSAIEHRVAPVTKGVRYSLVCWFVGPPFI